LSSTAHNTPLYPVERRNPRGDQVGGIPGTEEPLGADEQVVVVLMPADPGARLEHAGDLLFVFDQRGGELERARNECWTAFLSRPPRRKRSTGGCFAASPPSPIRCPAQLPKAGSRRLGLTQELG
jgi:hypothetical protein